MTILEQVAEQSGHSIERILSKRRFANITRARHVAMWKMRQTGMSFPAIGRVFDRHHTTVMYACERVEHEVWGGSLFSETRDLALL